MLKWLDRLAGWWMDTRTTWAVNHDPVMKAAAELGLEKVEVGSKGWEILATAPVVVDIADQLATMLETANAKNFVQFDMMPRLDRGLQPIRVTVQWAHGMSPGVKCAHLEERVRQLERDNGALQAEVDALTAAGGVQ